MVTGLRMNNNYIIPGGVWEDLPDGWEKAARNIVKLVPDRIDEYEGLLSENPIFLGTDQRHRSHDQRRGDCYRCHGSNRAGVRESIGIFAATLLTRSTRSFDFEVPIATEGDVYARYKVRMEEMRQAVKLIEQAINGMPGGDYKNMDEKITVPPRSELTKSMEAVIHHYKLVTQGYTVPAGEVYTAIESPRGELGLFRDLGRWFLAVPPPRARPIVRQPPVAPGHVRGRSDRRSHRRDRVRRSRYGRRRQVTPTSMGGHRGAKHIDPLTGGHEPRVLTGEMRQTAEAIVAKYPNSRSAALPLLFLVQSIEGHVTEQGMREVADILGLTPAEILATGSFYTMLKKNPQGEYLVSVCRNISCTHLGARKVLAELENHLGIEAGETTSDGKITLESAECLATCDGAPSLQINYEDFYSVAPDVAVQLVEKLRRGDEVRSVRGEPVKTAKEISLRDCNGRSAGRPVPRATRCRTPSAASRCSGTTVRAFVPRSSAGAKLAARLD